MSSADNSQDGRHSSGERRAKESTELYNPPLCSRHALCTKLSVVFHTVRYISILSLHTIAPTTLYCRY